ncbi:hypothetical protein Ciccas_008470 [Cichlidogyrus casuarinus]|uniref:Uncharacterized protein n=1 Tax=Cichlidogyrus casuarinus TaxID=1844966 RepID=A0ABD2PZX3_9PLAT
MCRCLIVCKVGSCDDEEETCSDGCSGNGLNRLFCPRSCPLMGSLNCESKVMSSCEFKSNYIGVWDWKMDNSNRNDDSGHVKVGLNGTMSFYNSLGLNKEQPLTLQCVREVTTMSPDHYILGFPSQENGWSVNARSQVVFDETRD